MFADDAGAGAAHLDAMSFRDDTSITTTVPLTGRHLRALIARAAVRHGRILTEGSMAEVKLKDFVDEQLTLVRLQVTGSEVAVFFNTDGTSELARYAAIYPWGLEALLAEELESADDRPVRFTVPTDGTTLGYLRGLAKGLSLYEAEDRSTFRLRVAAATESTRVDRLVEWAKDMDVRAIPRDRAGVTRALADAYIEHVRDLVDPWAADGPGSPVR